MRISDSELIERYLEGELGAEEAARVRQRTEEEPGFTEALVREAYDLEGLREALNGHVVAMESLAPVRRSANRRTLSLAIAAALAIVATAGWVAAWMSHLSMTEIRQELTDLRDQIDHGQIEADQTEHPTQSGRPLTIGRRGLLLALKNESHPTHSIAIGHEVPLDRRLWTCPWGAAEFRFSDGLTVALDRSTLATIRESADARMVHIRSGLLHVTNWPPRQDGEITVVHTPHARVRMTHAQITVDVRADRTVVETAEGTVSVTPLEAAESEPVSVSAQHYAIIKRGQDAAATPGRLVWSLEPMTSPDERSTEVMEP